MVEKEAQAPLPQKALRKLVGEHLYNNSFDIEARRNLKTEERLHELMTDNISIIQITNHWGLMEMPAVMKYNFTNPDLRQARTLLPFTSYRYKEKYSRLGRLVATELNRTATDDSDRYYKDHPEEKPDDYGILNTTYTRNAANLLSKGGVVLFSPQGKREATLPPKFDKPMLAAFIRGIEEMGAKTEKIAFMFVGTGLKDVNDYEAWKNTDYSDPHPPIQVNIGNIYTFEESGLRGRVLRADAWARSELAKVVPENYLAKRS